MVEKIDRFRLCLCKMGEEYIPYIHISITDKKGKVNPVPMSVGVDKDNFTIKVVEVDKKHSIDFIEGYAYMKNDRMWVNVSGKDEETSLTTQDVDEILAE